LKIYDEQTPIVRPRPILPKPLIAIHIIIIFIIISIIFGSSVYANSDTMAFFLMNTHIQTQPHNKNNKTSAIQLT
jgi:cytochrome c-type biogenesis protein CcmE